MPKAKPDRVVVHRIELQQAERDMLEAAVMTNGLAKAGQAAGALIAPFAGAFTAIVAAMIAKGTIEDLVGWAAMKLGEKEQVLADGYAMYLEAEASARSAVYPPGHEKEGELLNPGPHLPPMTRAEYDELYEKTAMTNWELVQYRIAETTGGILGESDPNPAGKKSRSDEKAEELNCAQITRVYGPLAGAACRAGKAKGGNWWWIP
jgi:hypothetical protein